MVVAIADTHTTLWYLFSDPRLGRAASAFIDATVADGNHVGVSAISVAEMVYLIEKGRIPATALTDVQAAVADPKQAGDAQGRVIAGHRVGTGHDRGTGANAGQADLDIG